MAVIDVLTVIDAVRVLKDAGPNDYEKTGKFYPLPHDGIGYVYMIVTFADAKQDAVTELDLFANAGDTIRWRMTTASEGANYQCIIKSVHVGNGADCIATPQMKHEIIKVPQVDTTTPDLDKLILQKTEDVYWETKVLKPGSVTYHFNFVLCSSGGDGDGSDCDCTNQHGGHKYDPYINKK